MKFVFLAALVACVCANPAVINEPVKFNLPPQTLHLKNVGQDDVVADEWLVKELTAFDSNGRNLIVNIITDMLEGFRDTIINGSDDLPPLDPFHLHSVGPIDFSMTGVQATLNIRNVEATGLGWFVVDDVSFNTLALRLNVQVTLPWLTVTGSYDARARVALLITHNAGGNFRVFVNRLEVGVGVRLGTNLLGGHLTLRELDIKIDIHDTRIQIDGMFGSSLINNFINSIVQNISHDVIQSQLETISDTISEALFDTINEVLRNFTLADILG